MGTGVQTKNKFSFSYTSRSVYRSQERSRTGAQSSLLWGHKASTTAESIPCPRETCSPTPTLLPILITPQPTSKKTELPGRLTRAKTTPILSYALEIRSFSIFFEKEGQCEICIQKKGVQKGTMEMVELAEQPVSSNFPPGERPWHPQKGVSKVPK